MSMFLSGGNGLANRQARQAALALPVLSGLTQQSGGRQSGVTIGGAPNLLAGQQGGQGGDGLTGAAGMMQNAGKLAGLLKGDLPSLFTSNETGQTADQTGPSMLNGFSSPPSVINGFAGMATAPGDPTGGAAVPSAPTVPGLIPGSTAQGDATGQIGQGGMFDWSQLSNIPGLMGLFGRGGA